MSALGLVMFACALALIIATGIPVYAVLLGVSCWFAGAGLLLGVFDWPLLGAIPARLVGLLEHDLLQALPLYAFIGALLNRLPLASQMHAVGERLFGRSAAAPELAAFGVGALLAPMNGSVGASLHMLSRSVAPALAGRATPAQAAATVCVASTLGIAIPPSLVLLLLGDAMMRAHTEAQNITHTMVRIVNTQDVMRAALVPGALVLLIALVLTAWRARGRPSPLARAALPRATWCTVVIAAAAIVVLLGAVALGRLYAVEAAATGCTLLLTYALISQQLNRTRTRLVLRDTMTLTGVLLALLIAATTFSLVVRAFGTDVLIADALKTLADRPTLMLLVVLGGLVMCSFVLDAFEMIFLVIPLVMPPLLMTLPDPAWVAALTLLVLQAGFVLPPFGYAVLMSRALMRPAPRTAALARALRPQLAAQTLLIAAVLAWPQVTRWARPDAGTALNAPATSEQADLLLQQAIDAQQRDRAANAKEDSTRP